MNEQLSPAGRRHLEAVMARLRRDKPLTFRITQAEFERRFADLMTYAERPDRAYWLIGSFAAKLIAVEFLALRAAKESMLYGRPITPVPTPRPPQGPPHTS